MPKKRKGPYDTHRFFCRRCFFVNKINRKVPFVGKFYHNSKKYVCGGLNSHLTSNCFKKCGDYYQTHGLLGFEQSLIQYQVQPDTSTRNHSASEIGVTPQSYSVPLGPSAINTSRNINDQVLYNVLWPSLDQSVINISLSRTSHSSIVAHTDEMSPTISVADASSVSSANSKPTSWNGNGSSPSSSIPAVPSVNKETSISTRPSNHFHFAKFMKVPCYFGPQYQSLPLLLRNEIDLLNILQTNNLP